MPEDNAETTSEILSWADLHGVDSHGMSMIPGYDNLRRSGRAKMDARPKIIKKVPQGTGVEWRCFHAFRRGLATRLYNNRTPIETVGKVLRHGSGSVGQK